MAWNKAIKTAFDEEEKRYLDIIDKSEDESEINAAKADLNNLSRLKWKSISNLASLQMEVEARLREGDCGVYATGYRNYLKVLAEGDDEATAEALRSLLTTSDSIRYSNEVKERKAELEELDEAIAGSGRIITTDGGPATAEGNEIYQPKQDENGVFTLQKKDPNAPILEEGAVVGGKVDLKQLDYNIEYLDRRSAWVDTNTEYHRQKTVNGMVVDSAIIKRYYSSMDAEIYFGNEYVEDIYDISWSIQQNNAPLFGYNSYTYDEIARGNRLIHGQFMINFTSPNYLFSILSAANKANVSTITNMASYDVPKLGSSVKPTFRKSAYGTREKGHHAAMWPETFDIDIIFGEKSGAGDPVHVIILGVAINSSQISLNAGPNSLTPSPGGSSVYEIYSFVAQDIRTEVLNSADAPSSYEESTDMDNGSGEVLKTDTGVPILNEHDLEREAALRGLTVRQLKAQLEMDAADKEARDTKSKREEISDMKLKQNDVEKWANLHIGAAEDISQGSNLARKGAQRQITWDEIDQKYVVTYSYPAANGNEALIQKLAEQDMRDFTNKGSWSRYTTNKAEINNKTNTYTVEISMKPEEKDNNTVIDRDDLEEHNNINPGNL